MSDSLTVIADLSLPLVPLIGVVCPVSTEDAPLARKLLQKIQHKIFQIHFWSFGSFALSLSLCDFPLGEYLHESEDYP